MRRDQFAETLGAFFQSPQPYRHLYVWHGEMDDLMSLMLPGRVELLDIFCLAVELSTHPFAHDEANELLRDALRARLRGWYAIGADVHPVLIVMGTELLGRYSIGLQPFYEVLTDRTMIILLCSAEDAAYDPAGRLPEYVRCEPGATLVYLSRLIEEDHVIEPG